MSFSGILFVFCCYFGFVQWKYLRLGCLTKLFHSRNHSTVTQETAGSQNGSYGHSRWIKISGILVLAFCISLATQRIAFVLLATTFFFVSRQEVSLKHCRHGRRRNNLLRSDYQLHLLLQHHPTLMTNKRTITQVCMTTWLAPILWHVSYGLSGDTASAVSLFLAALLLVHDIVTSACLNIEPTSSSLLVSKRMELGYKSRWSVAAFRQFFQSTCAPATTWQDQHSSERRPWHKRLPCWRKAFDSNSTNRSPGADSDRHPVKHVTHCGPDDRDGWH